MAKTKQRWTYQAPEDHHYFVSSVARWETGTNLQELIDCMKRDGFMFNIWMLPVPASAGYKIEYYAPVVEGRIYIGAFEPER